MAVVDPYAPCPCGSGEKFKWCCQKIEAHAEKAQRLLEGGQVDAALAALDDGLRKAPANPWLATRKAVILIRKGQPGDALPLLESVLVERPGHAGAQGLLVRVVLEKSGPRAGAAQLQRALSAVPSESRPALAIPAQLVGLVLSEIGHLPAAREHLALALDLRGGPEFEENASLVSALEMLERNPSESPWLRNPYELATAPGGLEGSQREQFEAALGLADEGLWADAAASFDRLGTEELVEAIRNLALCQLWTVEDEAATASMGRYVAAVGETTDAVDIEALRQLIAPPGDEELVDQVQLIWTLRDRAALIGALDGSDRTDSEGKVPLDPEDENSVEVDSYQLLDRPKPTGEPPRVITEYPQVLGRVLVGQEIVLLEGLDDGRLDALTGWFTDLAGSAVPPAQPKTKELGKLPRHIAALRTFWWMPEGVPAELATELRRQERMRVVSEVWPNTAMPYLGGRTPLEAAQGADTATRIALRAAVFQYEVNAQFLAGDPDFAALRERLGIAAEPEIDPATVEIEDVHLARLHLVPADRLDDERLRILYARARQSMMPVALERAARAVLDRPGLLDSPEVGRVLVFTDLANLALIRDDTAEAASWLARGRREDPQARGANAIRWDLADVRLRARTEPPEAWVPELAVILESYRADREAGQVLLSNLLEMGLIRMVPNPDNPEEILLDSRPLQAVLAEYGPRITTAEGGLGISATRGGIWTPGSDLPAGGSTTTGGIWTPGSGSGSAPPPAAPGQPQDQGKRPSLFIPGR